MQNTRDMFLPAKQAPGRATPHRISEWGCNNKLFFTIIQISKYSGIQISKIPDTQISKYPDTQISRYPAPNIQIFRYPNIQIEGWGEAQPGNRFGSVVRAYARSGSEVGIGENRAAPPAPFPFPFCRFAPGWYFVRVLCGSSESWWDLVSSNEIWWIEVSPSESKWVQVSLGESKWVRVQVSPSESKWVQVNPSESKWIQVKPPPLPPNPSIQL